MRATTLLLLVFALVAGAATTTFQPDGAVGKDVYTYSHYPGDNYGGSENLHCGTDGSISWATFIEFAGLNDSQYQGATVTLAWLYLNVYSHGSTGQFQVGACSSHWDEYTLTWNNMPAVHESFFANYPSSTGWYILDVTTYVQNWLDGTWTNQGFALYDNDGDEHASSYSSDYTSAPNLRPALYLEYSGAAVEEATWGEIKAGI